MNKLISNLFQKLDSQSYNEREEAVLSIALLLEKHSPLRNSEEFYQTNLPHPLSSFLLTDDEIEEIVKEVSFRTLSSAPLPSLVWAVGKALTISSLRVLLEILEHQENEDVLWQALAGVETIISGNVEPLHTQAKQLLNEKAHLIRKMTMSNHSRIREIATRINNYI